ncbi:MAG: DUF4445 domain-containing protein, partial [Spirochaetia bacterium]|nr:DUF4445 domain-containing protein [Spirochaetia bacterium]
MDTNGILAIDTSEQILHLPIKRRQTVLEMLIERGITQISSPCGGNGLCGKCLVLVTSFDGAGPTDDEKRLLTEPQLRAGYRLACRMQIGPESKLSIRLLKKSEQAQVISSYYTQARFEQPDSYDQECYGCAIDIGTTSVVVYLIRLDTHELVGHSAQMNVQKAYGADVISRIQFCNDHEKGLHILQSMIVGQLDAMIERVAKEYKVPLSLVSRIVVVGNPTMIHLLTGTDPSSIASAPFTPAFVDQKILLANDVGLACTPSAQLVLPGFVSAYIGSDITAV